MRFSLQAWRGSAPIYKKLAPLLLPTRGNFSKHWKIAAWQIAVGAIAYGTLYPFFPTMQERLAYLIALGSPWETWKLMTLATIGPIAIYYWWAACAFVVSLVMYIVVSILWRTIWVSSRPPSGVLGSIGILVALSNPIMRSLGLV